MVTSRSPQTSPARRAGKRSGRVRKASPKGIGTDSTDKPAEGRTEGKTQAETQETGCRAQTADRPDRLWRAHHPAVHGAGRPRVVLAGAAVAARHSGEPALPQAPAEQPVDQPAAVGGTEEDPASGPVEPGRRHPGPVAVGDPGGHAAAPHGQGDRPLAGKIT